MATVRIQSYLITNNNKHDLRVYEDFIRNYIIIKVSSNHSDNCASISLDKETTKELIKELQSLIDE